jgi:DNA processing protein
MDEKTSRALLSGCPSVGPMRFRRLEEVFGSGLAAWEAGPSRWGEVEGMGNTGALAKEAKTATARWPAEAAALAKAGVKLVVPDDPEYPEPLKSLDDRPFILYMLGEWRPLDALAVALVGSRKFSVYGRMATERLARELAWAGVTVVSGLARGIDSIAHETVVNANGRTFGVLGSGFGRFYPPENRDLARRMEAHGGVVTEHAWSADPMPANFPRRNRLISGMSLGVVVVEADVKSGALITARLAADQGRDVFAVPGSIFAPTSRGPHLLLKQGARPVEDAQDVLDALEVFRDLLPKAARPARAIPVPAGVQGPEAALLEKISLEPAGTDALSRETGLDAGSLAAVLLRLELKGLIKALPGKLYVRAEPALKG